MESWKAVPSKALSGSDLLEFAVLLFRHDLLHGVASTNTQGARLNALQRNVGAKGEPFIDHLSLLQSVKLATHEHLEGKRLMVKCVKWIVKPDEKYRLILRNSQVYLQMSLSLLFFVLLLRLISNLLISLDKSLKWQTKNILQFCKQKMSIIRHILLELEWAKCRVE